MRYFPFFLKIYGKRCLIVGGGKVASRRAKSLLDAGAIVDVISPVIKSDLIELINSSGGELIYKPYNKGDIKTDYELIIAATDKRAVNEEVSTYAKDNNILVNIADNPAECDFVFSSIIDKASMTVAISNNGNSPILSKIINRQINAFIPAYFDDLSSLAGEYRKEVNKKIINPLLKKAFWEKIFYGDVARLMKQGKIQEARYFFEQILNDFNEDDDMHGEVYLIGAGPGDPELLTIKALRLIQQSEVILYDRLVSQDIMDLIPPDVELVYVGKHRANHAMPQTNINQLLVKYAKQGKRVARLKGGDPFIFGRGGEEIETLSDHNINFQIIPGISAANGCSSYAGIPLTHRDYAQSVQFLTGQLKDGSVDLNWPELILEGKTLVFYMGLNSLPIICDSLIEYGMRTTMPVALIEKGTTNDQNVLISTLESAPSLLKEHKIKSPSLLIIGTVVNLYQKLHWFTN